MRLLSAPTACLLVSPLLVALLGCVHAEDAKAPPASTTTVRVEATVPPAMGRGTTSVVVYTAAEVEAGMPGDFTRFFDVLRRVRAVEDLDPRDEVIAFDVEVTARPAVISIVHDTAGIGLEAMLGAQPGVAQGRIPVEDGAVRGAVALKGAPFAPKKEGCVGERQTLLVLDAPETKRPGDDGKRLVCVQLPASYGAGERRYPVLLALPGFSGWHAYGDAWRARGIFEREGAALGVEAIIVGVGTRTAEGTSYLDTSARFGDWDAYVAKRLLPEIDARYRTNGRRAAVGHSTGGWNAVRLGTEHPDLIHAVGASAPDALDLDAWHLDDDGARMRADWLAWLRAEVAMGGAGQFVSYAASWSPDGSPRGYAWPVDLDTGAVIPAVYDQWRARSPAVRLQSPEGLRNAKRLSGAIVLTAGKNDEFGLFAPTARYAQALQTAGVDVLWLPTDTGHFGNDEVRFAPMAKHVMAQLRGP